MGIFFEVNLILLLTFQVKVRSKQYSNLTLNQLAEQQDDYPGGDGYASNAVDGNTDGNWEGRSIAHTSSANGWRKVTLKRSSYIAYIDIYNRMDSWKAEKAEKCQGLT